MGLQLGRSGHSGLGPVGGARRRLGVGHSSATQPNALVDVRHSEHASCPRGLRGSISCSPIRRFETNAATDQWRSDMAKPAKNTICLWYDRDAEEAARFYAKTFPDSSVGA